MILIGGNPPSMDSLYAQFPARSVERLVIDAMWDSEETYAYSSLEEFLFELRFRKETVNAARELNRSRLSFATFHNSKANPKYWDRTPNGGFRMKSGVKPSQAITDIFVNGRLYATECATAIPIVYYKAALNVFGAEKFDKTFDNLYLMNWQLFDRLMMAIGTPYKVKDILIGDRAYFRNPDVSPQTPELQGENVIVLPDGLYYGHGMGISDASRIIAVLNANRKRNATRSAYLMDSASRPDYKRLFRAYST